MINTTILIRGGGDLASGAALRLWRCGFKVVITENAQPLAVRRYVSYAQAVYRGTCMVEESRGILVHNVAMVKQVILDNDIPVFVDPEGESINLLKPEVVVDARMLKIGGSCLFSSEPLYFGLGPGFTAGKDCHAVIETRRGPFLGRVIWKGQADKDTGVPESVTGKENERVLRAPCDGLLHQRVEIGELVKAGQIVAEVNKAPVRAVFDGVVRGMLHEGLKVKQGTKIGDIDPRQMKELCYLVSDKALAVAGGVLEAVLSFKRHVI